MENNFKNFSESIKIYLFEIENFINSLSEFESNSSLIKNIRKQTEKLSKLHKELSNSDIKNSKPCLKNIEIIADTLLNELKKLKCSDLFLNEKTDLTAKTYMIWEHTVNFISSPDYI